MNSKNNPEFEVFQWVVIYIMKLNYRQLRKLTVDSLADGLNMSRAYLYIIFKTQKISPGKLLRKIKVTRACDLLRKKPKLSIKQISNKLGFNTTDYFIRVFKKYVGTTPLKYRQMTQTIGRGGVDIFFWWKDGLEPGRFLKALIKKLLKIYHYFIIRLSRWLKSCGEGFKPLNPGFIQRS